MIIPRYIKAIIFDYDGVIGDSTQFNTYACHEAAKKCGIDLESDIYRQCAPGGATIRDIATCIVSHYNMPDKVDEYIKYKKSFDKEYAEKVEIYPGIENVLKKLGSRYPLAVNTGTRRVLVSSVLNKYNIYKHFKFVVTAEDITKGKPDPESYQLAVNKLGMLPGGCLVVEDGKSGVQSAISAGCLVVGLINELTRQELEDLNCHFVIKNLSELMVPTSS